MSPRRITLSTVGVVPALERLATEPLMPNLAISLHATTEEQRDRLVPVNRKYGLADILDACRRFPLKRRSRITFEYVLLAGVNDTPDDARRLARLLGGIRCKVNLIPLNEAPGIPFERPSDARVDQFAEIARGASPDRVGPQEPRPRHPRGLRPADRGRARRSLPASGWRHASDPVRSADHDPTISPVAVSPAVSTLTDTHSFRARPGGILTFR